MPRRSRLVVVNITLQSGEWDFDEVVTFAGRKFRLVRIGTSGDLKEAERLVWQWSLKSDAIAVTGVREAASAGLYDGDVSAIHDLLRTTARVPVRDGAVLANVLQEWAIRHVQREYPGYFSNARTVVLEGSHHERAVAVLREFTDNIEFVDPTKRVGVPTALAVNPFTSKAAEAGVLAWRMTPDLIKARTSGPVAWMSDRLAHRAARDADVIVGSYSELIRFGIEDLSGKTVITNAVSEARLAELGRRGVDLVIDATPQPFAFMAVTAMFEAMAAALHTEDRELTTDDLLDLIQEAELTPRLLRPNGDKRKSRFAFVIHPLSQQYFKNVEPLRAITKVPGMGGSSRRRWPTCPPFVYSHVTGITSPTGAEAEGWLITVGGTPKEMLAHSPEFTYSRLLEAADLAKPLGAQVMGLGAFTKVVGDAGVTVAKRAPLPVTTGNSYSASGALWAPTTPWPARHRRARRRRRHPRQGHGRRGDGCDRLGLRPAARPGADELWLVSPRPPSCSPSRRTSSARTHARSCTSPPIPGDALRQMDLIVTATSAAGKRVLDIMKVKPGCVITDVARPLDMSAEDVAKRPDVLVIESGEIELPGEVHMRDIGLPPASPTPAWPRRSCSRSRAATRPSPSVAASSGPRSRRSTSSGSSTG
jgi:hypothetical protein